MGPLHFNVKPSAQATSTWYLQQACDHPAAMRRVHAGTRGVELQEWNEGFSSRSRGGRLTQDVLFVPTLCCPGSGPTHPLVNGAPW